MASEVEEHQTGRRILVAVDRNDESIDALNWALEKVCRKSDKLVILHVTCPIEEPHLYEMDFMFHKSPTSAHMLDELQEKEEAAAAQLMHTCKELAEKAHIHCETVVEEGDPREVICALVLASEPDLLVVASRGKASVLNRAALGSVSSYLVKNAGCPVLVARPTSHTLEKKRKEAILQDRFGLSSWVWAEQSDDGEEEGA